MANGSFFQNAVEKANKKPATTVERLAEAYNKNTQRGSTAVETPVLDSAVKQNSKQALSPASSLEEFMGILPTPEVKNDGLDGTPYADVVRSEWKRMGVDNARDYAEIRKDYASRGVWSGVSGAARDSVNYLYNLYQQAKNNIAKGNQYATGDELLYQDVLKKTGEEYKDKPLEKAVHWGEAYDKESERIAQELNVNEEARKDYQFNQAVGRMAPAIAVSATGNLVGGGMTLLGAGESAKGAYAVGRFLSSAATFTSAAGGAYEDAKAHGIDDDKAMTYAATVGAIELAAESVSSGLGKIGGKAIGTGGFTDDFVSSLAKKVSSDPNVQNAVIYAGGVLGEGFEEWLSEWGDYAANRLLVKYDDRTLRDVWGDSKESFMQGAMMSSLLNITQLMQRGVPPKEAIRQGVDETAAEAGISPAEQVSPAAQTMARAATQNAVQETAPARTEVSPAAQTMAQVLLGNREPLQQNIDTNTAAAYNDSIENNLIGGGPNGGAETDGNGIAREGLRLGRDGAEADQALPGRREADGRGNLLVSGIVLLSPEAQNILKARGVDIVETQDVSANSTAFSHALDEARSADADHGWAVTPKTAEELSENGVRSFMDANGTTGFAIAPDGDIEAVFSNKAKGAPKGSTKSTIPQAVALGGTKLDCYGYDLVNLYHQYGFEPVARVKFNPEYANPGWDASKGTPDIYFMMHNGDSADTVVQKTGTYEPVSLADLAALPEMDYDTAYAYRDNLLAQRGKPVNENTQNAAEQLTPIAQVVLGRENMEQTAQAQPTADVNAEATGAPRFPSAPVDPSTPAKVSETATTVRDSVATPEGVKQLINDSIEDGGYHYFPITNDATVDSAAARIQEKGYDSVLRDWTASVRNGQTGAELAVTGQLLYDAAVKGGDTGLALDILSDYQLLGTNTAQGLQAMRLIKNQTPEGKLYLFKKTVDNMYDSLSDRAKAELPDGFSIDENLINEYVNAPDAKTEQAAYKALVKDIGRQLPSSPGDKWNALRYLNMLGNFRTQGRNLAGNTGMMAVTAAKNTVRYGFERLAEAVTGGKYQRNTSLTVSREMMNAARADYDVYADFINGDSKYSEGRTTNRIENDIRDNRTVFKSDKPGLKQLAKAAEGYRKATNWAMEAGDTVFIKQQYARYLAGYLEAHGMDGQTFTQIVNGDIAPSVEQQSVIDAGRNFAAREAQEATFHDTNAVSKWVSKMGRGDKTPWAARILLEGALPFRKTPANVAVRAVEYSPAGFLDTVVKTVQAAQGKNGVTGADVINSLSKSMTGTGLFALGMMLREAGWLRGKEDDEDKDAFDKMRGEQDYSLVLPNGWSITMDWLSPAAIPVFMGVSMYDAIQDNGLQTSDFIDVLTKITDPMIEMSMLQGINDTLDNIKYSDNNLIQLALSTTMSYLTQGLTNTLLGQAERTFEDRRYSTFIDGDNRTENVIQRNIGKASAKIPGLDYHQVEYVDAWGRTEYTGNAFARAFENFLSPGYLSKQNSTEVDNELQRLYDAGERNVLPKRIGMSETVNVYRNDGRKTEERRLTKDEYVQYQKVMGQTSLELVKDLMKSPVYKGMSDEAKASAISEIYGYARRMAAMAVEPSAKYGEKTDVSKLSNPAAYYAANASFNTASKDSENRNYGELDSLTASFSRLPPDVRDAVTEGNAGLARMLDAKENGYSARQYFNVYDTVKSLTPAEGYSGVATWQKIDAVCSMNTPDAEKDYFVMNYFEGSSKDKYTAAREAGYSPYSVAVAYREYTLSKGVDLDGDGKSDRRKAFIAAMMEQGASKSSAEWLYKLFSPNK